MNQFIAPEIPWTLNFMKIVGVVFKFKILIYYTRISRSKELDLIMQQKVPTPFTFLIDIFLNGSFMSVVCVYCIPIHVYC